MYVPCMNGKCASMIMSEARKDLRRNRQDKQDNYNRALRLHKTYPHLKAITVRFLMWALQRIGMVKLEEAAALNMSPFTFKRAVHQLNQGTACDAVEVISHAA